MPTRSEAVADDKAAYVKYAEARLDQLEERVENSKDEAKKQDLLASIREARTTVVNLESAADPAWRGYRDRVEGLISRVSNNVGVAAE